MDETGFFHALQRVRKDFSWHCLRLGGPVRAFRPDWVNEFCPITALYIMQTHNFLAPPRWTEALAPLDLELDFAAKLVEAADGWLPAQMPWNDAKPIGLRRRLLSELLLPVDC